MKAIILCGRSGGCCPVLWKPTNPEDENLYTLKDDFGGKVKLTKEQLQKLQNVVL